MGKEAISHPLYVEIPDAKTKGVRAYAERAEAHPLQLAFLEAEGEYAYVEHLRALLTAGNAAEADRIVSGDLAGFDGAIARLGRVLPPEAVTLDGWADLMPILDEYEGPAITALTVGLTNEPDLVFESGVMLEPSVLFGLYSDDAFDFSAATPDELLAECGEETPGWVGQEEDVEFYTEIVGLAELNTALIQCKHRYFLRDGRDEGVGGRAPGGYVEYILGCWLRAIRFVQAVERAIKEHGIPDGARVIAGAVAINTDFATVIEPKRRGAKGKGGKAMAPAPVAVLSVKPWVPRPDPTLDEPDNGPTLRQRIAEASAVAPPLPVQIAVAPVAVVVAPAAPVVRAPPPAPAADALVSRPGFFARLFARFR
jgi:hypothetical protein